MVVGSCSIQFVSIQYNTWGIECDVVAEQTVDRQVYGKYQQ